MNRCPWCRPNPPDDIDPGTLCRRHQAEWEGVSMDALDRRDQAEALDEFWSHH